MGAYPLDKLGMRELISLSSVVVKEVAFEKAQDKAREERLRRALEYETSAHRALCQHYNDAIETIIAIEAQDKDEIIYLEGKVQEQLDELLATHRKLESYKAKLWVLSSLTIFLVLLVALLASGMA